MKMTENGECSEVGSGRSALYFTIHYYLVGGIGFFFQSKFMYFCQGSGTWVQRYLGRQHLRFKVLTWQRDPLLRFEHKFHPKTYLNTPLSCAHSKRKEKKPTTSPSSKRSLKENTHEHHSGCKIPSAQDQHEFLAQPCALSFLLGVEQL